MTSTPVDINETMACLSPEMIDKLQYACQAYIKELLILKKDEEEKGNVEQYSWLNIEEYQQLNMKIPTQHIIEELFDREPQINEIRLSVISDYFVIEDVPILKQFAEKYYVDKYCYAQNDCEKMWKRQMLGRKNTPLEHLNMISELTMYFYMEINKNLVIDSLQDSDTNNVKLK